MIIQVNAPISDIEREDCQFYDQVQFKSITTCKQNVQVKNIKKQNVVELYGQGNQH